MDKKSSENNSFGEWVRQRRRILDLTQQKLADQVGCARITLRRIESGALKPSKELAQILLEKLGAPLTNDEAWLRFARGLSGLPDKLVHAFICKPITNLPASLSTFIGREKQQDETINLLAKNRLVTLAGVGGIGKTRLALQVGQKLLNIYPDGVWFVALDALSDPSLVPQTVASIFDIRERADRPVTEILRSVLREKALLLILDNCEHLLDDCAQLIKILLQSCPNLKVLATSREILNLEGEAKYFLPSLALPASETSFETLTEYESVKLFTERATLALSSFRLAKKNAKSVTDICHLVDGIPLAIELAAAHINILQVEEILKQLNDCFDLLVVNNRTTLPRHQTMRASIDWSWGLLNKQEQMFMRQLSVFAGGWTLESAQAVCEGDALNLTSALVRKSLITVNQESGYETRYHFHEIVRQYAREKLIQAGEENNICTRHLKYFVQFSEHAESALRGPTQMEWFARLNDERDNIRAALDWANETDVEAGLYVSARLHGFWKNFDLSEGARWLARFLHKKESNHYPLARAKALCIQARIMSVQDYNFAYIEAQESLDLYRANGDKSGEIDALLASGLTLTDFNAPIEKVMNLYEHALILSESIGDQWRQAYTLTHMGWPNNNYQRSISTLEKAVTIFEKVGDLESATEHMLNLVMLHMINGNLQLAEKWLDKVVKMRPTLNNKGLEMDILHHYGCLALIRGDYERARANLLESMVMAQALGHRIAFLWTHVRLGYIALREGNLVEARNIFIETAHNFQKDENTIGVVFTLEGMAELYVTAGKPERAAQLIGWANTTREKIGDTRPLLEQADVDTIIAACVAKMGEAAFSDAYDQGQKMSLDEAVDLALKTVEKM